MEGTGRYSISVVYTFWVEFMIVFKLNFNKNTLHVHVQYMIMNITRYVNYNPPL